MSDEEKEFRVTISLTTSIKSASELDAAEMALAKLRYDFPNGENIQVSTYRNVPILINSGLPLA